MTRLPTPYPPIELRFWHGLQGLVLAILLMAVFLGGLILLGEAIPPAEMLMLQTVVVSAAFGLGAVWSVHRTGNFVFRKLSIRWAHPAAFVLAAIGVLFAGALCDEVAGLLHRWKPDFFTLGGMGEIAELITSAGPMEFVLLSVALSLFPGVGEELMFRGLILRCFRRDMPLHFAIIYSSILFGVVHFSWLQGTAAALLGVYLALTVVLSGSVAVAMTAHLVNNLSWSLLARYQPDFMDEIMTQGHSTFLLTVSAVVVSLSLLGMWKLGAKKE